MDFEIIPLAPPSDQTGRDSGPISWVSLKGMGAYNSRELRRSHGPQKISGSKKVKFWLGDPDPQIWGPSPHGPGTLYRDPRVVPKTERTVEVSISVTEIIAIEN